jgi:hypothetical protein
MAYSEHYGGGMEKLLFIDTNIWLDFYRPRNESALALLKHAESVSEKIIVTAQLEAEYKRNRQDAILEGLNQLKNSEKAPRLGIFSEKKAQSMLDGHIAKANIQVKKLKAGLARALDKPTSHDEVYKACQRIFHRDHPIVLKQENPLFKPMQRKAFRRWLLGMPPRKKNDTSIGDAINWEWMVHCAKEQQRDLVIVSRDGDYGCQFNDVAYINDYLRQDFSERVSKKRKLILYRKLSEALKHFEVPVTAQEEADEENALAELLG